MRWKLAGAVLSLLVALGCSACAGSLLTRMAEMRSGSRVMTVKSVTVPIGMLPSLPLHVPPRQLPLHRSAVGTWDLGIFAIHGWLVLKATCVGIGQFEVDFLNRGSQDAASSACQNSSSKLTLDTGSNFGDSFDRAEIWVHASPGTRWTIDIREGQEPQPAK